MTIHMVGLRRTGLAEILTPSWQWTWSITAVLSVEVLAAGAMIANAVAGEPAQATTGRRRFDQSGRWERLLDAATDRAVDQLTPDPQPVTDRVNGKVVQAQPSDLAQLEQANAVRAAGKEAALEALLNFYAANPTASQSEAGQAIGRAKSTVGGYLAELEDAGLVERGM